MFIMLTGDIENGVEHLGNAVAVCGQPQQLLQVLQQTLPPQVFQLLLMKLPIAGQVNLAFCYLVFTGVVLDTRALNGNIQKYPQQSQQSHVIII
jgi:hypothetical protein